MPRQKLTLLNGHITRTKCLNQGSEHRPAGSESLTAGLGAHGQSFSLHTKPALPVTKTFGICECFFSFFFLVTALGGGALK